MMIPQPPPGQGPIDPRGAFSPPPAPHGTTPQYIPPPPQAAPPGMMPPYPQPPMYMPPPKPGGSFARGIFMTLATTIFGLSLAMNIYLLVYSGFFSESSTSKAVIEGDPKEKIAVVPIDQAIFDATAQQFDRFMTTIEKESNVQAVVLEIDTPGGSVTASDEIHHRIMQFKTAKPNTPVIVAMRGLATSGGYYVACACDYIFAEPSTLTGNIGVLMPSYNISEWMDKHGLKETTIVANDSKFKNAESWFQPEDPQARAYMQDLADKAYAQFQGVVTKGRTNHAAFNPKATDKYANGKAFIAGDALALGLIDKIGYPTDAYDYAAQLKGLKRKMVVRYTTPPGLFGLFGSQSHLPAPSASSGVTINGINIDSRAIVDLTTPRLMYLWRGE